MRFKTRPTHYRLGGKEGTMSACGIYGIAHRAIRYTDDRARVSCENCLRWLTKQEAAE